MLQRHAVVLEKAAQGEGKGCQHTDPADLAGADDCAQAEVNAHSHGNGQQGKNELPERKPEKQAFLIISDFLVDAYLYMSSPPFSLSTIARQRLAIYAGVC